MSRGRAQRNAVRNAKALGVPVAEVGPTPEVRARLGLDVLTRMVRTGTLSWANVLAAMQLRHCMESELLDLAPHAQVIGPELSLPRAPSPSVSAMPRASRLALDFDTRRTYRAW